MNKFKIILSVVFVFIYTYNFSQNNYIYKVNGKVIPFTLYKLDSTGVNFFYLNSKGKVRYLELEEIFSINNENPQNGDIGEIIFYKPDSLHNNFYSVEQMRSFVSGAYQARLNYRTPLLLEIGGFTLGAASTMFLSPLYSIIPPALYSPAIGITQISHKKTIENNPSKKDDLPFLEGYKYIAKNKRSKNLFISSALGIIAGFTGAIIISNSK